MSQKCTAVTKTGMPCKAWAVIGSDPPRCAAHGGGRAPVGAPVSNTNAQTHGFYAESEAAPTTIEEIIEDLAAKQAGLSQYIDNNQVDVEDLIALLTLHGSNASRLGRLLRDRRALSGEASDGIAGAIAQALDELGSELGADLGAGF